MPLRRHLTVHGDTGSPVHVLAPFRVKEAATASALKLDALEGADAVRIVVADEVFPIELRCTQCMSMKVRMGLLAASHQKTAMMVHQCVSIVHRTSSGELEVASPPLTPRAPARNFAPARFDFKEPTKPRYSTLPTRIRRSSCRVSGERRSVALPMLLSFAAQ